MNIMSLKDFNFKILNGDIITKCVYSVQDVVYPSFFRNNHYGNISGYIRPFHKNYYKFLLYR